MWLFVFCLFYVCVCVCMCDRFCVCAGCLVCFVGRDVWLCVPIGGGCLGVCLSVMCVCLLD